ncbi:MAG: UDP-N-acetylmuramoyl-L-alanine--D-glutamate ligase [Elusimicrobiota bacterium]
MMTRFDPKAFKRKHAVVLGLGRSGEAAAKLLLKKGFRVFGSDSRPRKELRRLASRLGKRFAFEGGGHSDRILRAAFAVKSPGMHPDSPALAKLRAAGIPVFSEMEVALAFLPEVELVAVTGTNGKTTTAALTAAVFQAARRRTHLLGNVGTPLAASASRIRKGDTVVLEVSSYQLEDSVFFRPDSSVILNITSDHLEHHKTMQSYIAAKARVFRLQDRSCCCVFNAADPLVLHLARSSRSRKLFFAREPSTRASAWIAGGKIRVRLPGEKKESALVPPAIPGVHNLENAMAAALLGFSRRVGSAAVARAFRKFKGVEHRIEDCGTVRGLRIVNDSKGTNVDSTLAALRALESEAGRLLLILGGLPKGGGFAPLRPLVEKTAKAVLTIGSAARSIEGDLQGSIHVFPCETLETAVEVAFKIGAKGDTLLLSPACASFDQFKDFEDRGRRFKEIVRKYATCASRTSKRGAVRGRIRAARRR